MSIADELQKLDDLRRRGVLSDDEFARAKATILDAAPAPDTPLSEHLAEVRYQNELARIDREWSLERQKYLMRGRHGSTYEPTVAAGLVTAVLGGVSGLFWTAFTLVLTQSASAPRDSAFAFVAVGFPLFGVLFTLLVVVGGASIIVSAQKYAAAQAEYQDRRRRALLGQSREQAGRDGVAGVVPGRDATTAPPTDLPDSPP